jgi:hypothetical protein
LCAQQSRPESLARRAAFPKEDAMAKGQKKSNREIRKPKAAKAKPAANAPSFLAPSSKKK